jgi:NAD(P)-dependent dehydrogenase (short-subunit alcohol dehydrogenase family)
MKKYALVTGGSRGIGRAICRKLASMGYHVLINYVSREDAALQTLELIGGQGELLRFDVADPEAVAAAVSAWQQAHPEEYIEVLVNNAGIMDDMAGIADFSDEKLESVFNVNVFGPFYATRKAVNVLKGQNSGGSIIHIASEGAYKTCAGAVYCASKAAVVSLSRNTAYMYKDEKIRSNAIVAGGFKTEIANSMGMPNMESYGKIQKVLATAPEVGEPVEIANACLFLASDESAYVSGAELAVDGGWCAA